MNFPKLKNTIICQLVLYAPALLFFAVIFLGAPLMELFDGAEWLWLGLFLASACFSLFYLFRYMLLFMATDILFATVRFWQKDRRWYPAAPIGRTRQEAEGRILGKLWGREVAPDEQLPCPLAVRVQRKSSLAVHYRGIEQIAMVYSVSDLDEDQFHLIMASARANLRSIRLNEKDFLLLDPGQKKQPVATATVVVILADTVSDTVAEKIRSSVSCSRGCMLPCAVDFSVGKCWYDGMGEAYMMGMTPKPEKNYAQDILRNLLFCGFLPLKDAGPMLTFPVKGCSPDMTLMELLKQYDDVMDLELLGFLKIREKWITRKMKSGDVMLHKGMLYCKLHSKVAELMTETDLNDPRNIRITLPERWCLPKQNKTSKEDRQRIRKQAESWLVKQGYRVFIAPENEK